MAKDLHVELSQKKAACQTRELGKGSRRCGFGVGTPKRGLSRGWDICNWACASLFD